QLTSPLGDGAHAFIAQAIDAAGNRSSASSSFQITVDTVRPGVSTPTTPSLTNDNTPTFSGSIAGEAGATVSVYLDSTNDGVRNGVLLGTTLVGTNNTWMLDTPADKAIIDGKYQVYTTVTDVAGNTGLNSSSVALEVDTNPPANPVIVDITDSTPGGIVGTVPDFGLTNDNTPTLSGTAEAGSQLDIYANGIWLGAITVPSNGQWSYTPTARANGTWNFKVVSTDLAGNKAVEEAIRTVTIDAIAPLAPTNIMLTDDVPSPGVVLGNGSFTNDAVPTYSGSAEPNAIVHILLDSVDVGTVLADATGAWSWQPALPLLDGTHRLQANAEDAAGNVGASTSVMTFLVDTAKPLAPSIVAYNDNINPNSGNYLDGSVTNDTTPMLSVQVPSEVFEGQAKQVTIRIYDTMTIDGVTVTRELGTFQSSGGSVNFTTPVLSEGEHVLTAVTMDQAGNLSPVSDPFTLTVDLLAPAIPTITLVEDDAPFFVGTLNDGDLTNDGTLTVSGTGAAGTTISLYAGSGAGVVYGTTIVGSDGSWSLTTSRIPDGGTFLRVRASDAAGNQSADSNSYNLTIDTVIPATSGGTNPYMEGDGIQNEGASALVGESKGGIFGSLSDGTSYTVSWFEYDLASKSIVGGPLASTTVDPVTGTWTMPTLPDPGDKQWHLYQLVATDAAGNARIIQQSGTSSSADAFWNTTLDPWANTSSGQYVYLSGSANWRAIKFDNDPLSSPLITSLYNDNFAEMGFTQDATGAGRFVSNDTTPSIGGVGRPGSTIRIYAKDELGTETLLGTATVAASGTKIGTWTFTTTALSSGTYTFYAKTYNVSGEGAASPSWTVTVDLDAPDAPPTIDSFVTDAGAYPGEYETGHVTNDSSFILKGTGEPNGWIRIYDGGAQVSSGVIRVAADGTWSYALGAQQDGTHNYRAVHADEAGNIGDINDFTTPFVVVVDTLKPNVPNINTAFDDVGSSTGPLSTGSSSDDTKPRLSGTGEPNGTVEIRDGTTVLGTTTIDGSGQWTLQLTADLGLGAHSLTARVTDASGNVSNPSAVFTYTVVAPAPLAMMASFALADTEDAVSSQMLLQDDSAAAPAASISLVDDETEGQGTAPVLYGNGALAGGVVEVYDATASGTVLVGTTIADAKGHWSFATPELAEGAHNLSVAPIDPNGRAGPRSPAWNIEVGSVAALVSVAEAPLPQSDLNAAGANPPSEAGKAVAPVGEGGEPSQSMAAPAEIANPAPERDQIVHGLIGQVIELAQAGLEAGQPIASQPRQQEVENALQSLRNLLGHGSASQSSSCDLEALLAKLAPGNSNAPVEPTVGKPASLAETSAPGAETSHEVSESYLAMESMRQIDELLRQHLA
ncbi:hypothetical protein BTE77_35130, partial [Ensifer adhaerens]